AKHFGGVCGVTNPSAKLFGGVCGVTNPSAKYFESVCDAATVSFVVHPFRNWAKSFALSIRRDLRLCYRVLSFLA
ncbi:MAG: hypothetical protein LBR10_16330, partial [Prevotellaceae bacterium]|nr:hypothetical protein [Prevotellaceae bacterium]